MIWRADELTRCYNMGTLFVIDDDDDDDDDDDYDYQLFWRNGWPKKSIKPYFCLDHCESLSTLQTSNSGGIERHLLNDIM